MNKTTRKRITILIYIILIALIIYNVLALYKMYRIEKTVSAPTVADSQLVGADWYVKEDKDMDKVILKLKLDESVNIKDYMKSQINITKDNYYKYDLKVGKPIYLASEVIGNYIFDFKLNLESKSNLKSLYNLEDDNLVQLKLEEVNRSDNMVQIFYKIDKIKIKSESKVNRDYTKKYQELNKKIKISIFLMLVLLFLLFKIEQKGIKDKKDNNEV